MQISSRISFFEQLSGRTERHQNGVPTNARHNKAMVRQLLSATDAVTTRQKSGGWGNTVKSIGTSIFKSFFGQNEPSEVYASSAKDALQSPPDLQQFNFTTEGFDQQSPGQSSVHDSASFNHNTVDNDVVKEQLPFTDIESDSIGNEDHCRGNQHPRILVERNEYNQKPVGNRETTLTMSQRQMVSQSEIREIEDKTDPKAAYFRRDRSAILTSEEKQVAHGEYYRNNEKIPKYKASASGTTSRTSGYYSSGSATNITTSYHDEQSVEHKKESTARYIQDTCADRPLRTSSKFPSEPTLKPEKKNRSTSRTQENIFNITDSNVSVNGGLMRKSCSSLSIYSSSDQETRQDIEDETEGILENHRKGKRVPEQRRLKRAKKVLSDEGIVVIIGKDGSGLTQLGLDLMDDDKSPVKYNIIDIKDLTTCCRSKGSVVIFVDDAFDNDSSVETCLKHIKAHRKNRSIKLIFAVKYHEYNQCKSKLKAYTKCIIDLEDPSNQLSHDEMLHLMEAMIANNGERLKVDFDSGKEKGAIEKVGKRTLIRETFLHEVAEVALPSGFPKKFIQFLETKENTKKGLTYFTQPTDALKKEIIDMKKSKQEIEKAKAITLAMTVVFGEKLTLEKVSSANFDQHQPFSQTAKKRVLKGKGRIVEHSRNPKLSWWIEIICSYHKGCNQSVFETVKAGIKCLNGTYLKSDTKGVFSFVAPCIKNAVLISMGMDFPNYILKFCGLKFFQQYIRGNNGLETETEQIVQVDIHNASVCQMANELLLKLANGGNIECVARHVFLRDQGFIAQFLLYLDADSLWKLCTAKDVTTERYLIPCLLDVWQQSTLEMNDNLAYRIVMHKVWGQKRRGNKEFTMKMEKEVIFQCCKRGHTSVYFQLRNKYNIAVDFQCLLASVRCGSKEIVDDILHVIGKGLSDIEKCQCMEMALLQYTRNPLKSRHDVADSLLKLVSIDYKICGIDPIIHHATKSGDARVIVTLNVFHGDINISNSDGKTCLHEAVLRNKTAFLRMALNHGADQKKADRSGALPIHVASRKNKPYMMELLLSKDPDIAEAADKEGRQPIHYAAIHGSVDAAKVLLDEGVEVDACDYEKNTPLHYAAASKKADVLYYLLEANADLSKGDKNGQSPLQIACKAGNEKGVKRILKRSTREELIKDHNESMFIAVEQNHPSILKMLLDKGFNVNKRRKCGNTLLCFAIEVNESLIPTLIENGCDMRMSHKNQLPLHVAANRGQTETFEELVDAGSDIKATTLDNDDTVLHFAAENGHDTLVYKILNMADTLTGYRNRRHEVPLHVAARQGNLPVTRALLAYGAERSPINKRSQTPLCIVNEKLKELQTRQNSEEYKSYFSIKLLLEGHKAILETAL